MIKILCRECWESMFGTEWVPPTFGKSTCQECGRVDNTCYEYDCDEDEDEDED